MSQMIHHLENADVYRISLFAPQSVAGKEYKTLEEAQAALEYAEKAFKAGLAKWMEMVA